MEATLIRQKLHNYLEIANEKKIKAMYTMMEHDIEESLVEYTDEFKKELDSRLSDYEMGKAKMITAEESNIRISKLLNKKSP